jgi:ABC-type amino acid transport system permease subunit
MLGMLGTFVGMVVTFKGAVLALEGSADLQAIRTALSAPIKGLGLSFGTSVAGVAASAALGLLATISRRERQEAVRLLDRLTHTVFRAFSLVHQRQATYQAVQDQSQALPQVAAQLAALIEGLEQRHTQLGNQLLAQQTQFHQQVSVAYTGLAESVGAALQGSLVAGAKAAGDSLLPGVVAAMRDMAQESGRVHQRQVAATQLQLQGLTEGWQTQVANLTAEVARLLGEFEVLTQKRVESEGWWRQEHQMHMDTLAQQLAGLGAALEAPMNRLMQTVAEVPRAATTVLAELRREAAQFNEQDVHTAEERLALVSQINALVVATQTVLEQANARFSAALEQHHAHTAEAATQVSAGAIELSSLGAAFEQGLQQFGATNHKLVDGLQRMELALQQSMARSDEQLAYYVAQAREVIDLSITSQQGIVQDLRRLRAQPTTAAETA